MAQRTVLRYSNNKTPLHGCQAFTEPGQGRCAPSGTGELTLLQHRSAASGAEPLHGARRAAPASDTPGLLASLSAAGPSNPIVASRNDELVAAAMARLTPEQREIRTAFIGIGHRGTALTGQVLKQENVRVASICDIDPKARDAALTLTSRDNPRSFTEYRQVLDLKDVDAVIIATPCYLHAEIDPCDQAEHDRQRAALAAPDSLEPDPGVLADGVGDKLRRSPGQRGLLGNLFASRLIADRYLVDQALLGATVSG